MYQYPDYLYHHGVKGMKWGVRRYQNYDGSLTSKGKAKYYKESSVQIKTNSDGSKVFPKGFVFNRVGKSSMDINSSGGLYVGYGKEDAARYIKNLGQTPIQKLLGRNSDTVQHITVKSDLKMPSDSEVTKHTINALASNDKILDKFNNSIYSVVYTGEYDKKVTKQELNRVLKDPQSKDAKRLSYSVNSFFGSPNYAKETQYIYDIFRKMGYDAVPDVHDRLSGTSNTAMIIINPGKVEVGSTTHITKRC